MSDPALRPTATPGPEVMAVTSHSIVRWLVPEGERKLEIVVAASPLAITERFCWQDFTNNHYGQGNKRTWWRWAMGGKPTIEVRGEGADLLTALVHEHAVLSKLADYLLFPTRSDASNTHPSPASPSLRGTTKESRDE